MLKPIKPKTTIPRNTILWTLVGLLILSGIIALIMSFNSADEGVDEVNAVYTNAAATLAVQQLTLQASSPSVTPTTFTMTPTATFTPFASPTLSILQPLTTSTTSSGGVSGAVGCNNSEFVADVTFSDNTVVAPGQTFTKTWKLQNNGTCPWTASYKVTFLSGNAMGGNATPINITVNPGQSADVSVAMVAPTTAGDAVGYWKLSNDSNQQFGTSFYVLVKVGGAATTGTATTTPTTGAVATTAVPSNTPTETPTETPKP